MEEPGFWDDADRATKLVQEAKNLKDTVDLYRGLEQQYEDIQVMIEMGYEEEDPALIPEIQEMLDEFERNLEKLRMETLLSGEYDKYNAVDGTPGFDEGILEHIIGIGGRLQYAAHQYVERLLVRLDHQREGLLAGAGVFEQL